MCDSDPDQETETKNRDPESDIPVESVMSIPDDTADHCDEDECKDK